MNSTNACFSTAPISTSAPPLQRYLQRYLQPYLQPYLHPHPLLGGFATAGGR